jgi:peroxiredoxin
MGNRSLTARFAGIVLIAFIAAFTGALLDGCGKKEDSEKKEATAPVRQSADAKMSVPFKIKTFGGTEFSLESARGKVVVLNFFASWCGPCKQEAPGLQRAYAAFKDSGVVFIGVAVDDTENGAREFLKHYGITFPAGLDADGRIASAYNLYGVPDTFIIGTDGRVRFSHTGDISEEELISEIKKAL